MTSAPEKKEGHGKGYFTATYAGNSLYSEATDSCTVSVTRHSNSSSSDDPTTYTVSVDDTDNGDVTVSPRQAERGETVTITIDPDEGYELDELTVTDSDGAYYYDAAYWAVENGVTNGTTATTFSPDATVTRAQTVTFLWRSAVLPLSAAAASRMWCPTPTTADAVALGSERGITSGTSETTFAPTSNCTRAQIVTFLYRRSEGNREFTWVPSKGDPLAEFARRSPLQQLLLLISLPP